ncbi:MAG: glycoside hydrolase family 99-like domain-containing protein [Micrococcales bacterium]|nr:glycoside hydrolase family 99-like domain-containing protein [Micrococcales bacterium]
MTESREVSRATSVPPAPPERVVSFLAAPVKKVAKAVTGRELTKQAVRGRVQRARIAVAARVAGRRVRRSDSGSRTSLSSWLARRDGRRPQLFPDHWRTAPVMEATDPSRVAVVMHVFFPELVDELLDQLRHVPVDFDLLVTNSSGSPLELDTCDLTHVRHVAVLDCQNRGRDIAPMVALVNAGLLDPYRLVLKVHTKRSDWRADHAQLSGTGSQWRTELLEALLGDEENVTAVLRAFAADDTLGVVTADGSVLGPQFWGGDHQIVDDLAQRIALDVDAESLRFASGSMYWVRGFVLQGLRSFGIDAEDFAPEAGQVDGTAAHAVERLVGIVAAEAALSVVERGDLPDHDADLDVYDVAGPVSPRVRVVPFYLPQFHPTPENDRWWGTGFTEWRNVVAARPLFPGQEQPRLPGELGFYDLRMDEVRQAQRDLAVAHGVEGFMYYYYWFAGERLLSVPVKALVGSDLDQPFCLMWANENWTRRWDGRSEDLLIGQHYDKVPATQFIDDVMDLLTDDRYLRIDGAAVLSVYRISQIPDYPQVLEHWRRRAREAGVGELFIVNVDVAAEFDGLDRDVAVAGLDGTHWFPPHNARWDWIDYASLGMAEDFTGNLLSYHTLVRDAEERLADLDERIFPAVMVDFDNTARRNVRADLWWGSNPYTFRRWVASTVRAVEARPAQRRVVFVNAWNEWAESAVLEPSERHGRGYLLALRDVVIA